MRKALLVGGLATVVLASGAAYLTTTSEPEPLLPLWQVSSPTWSATLGGEDAITQADLKKLDAYSFGLTEPSVDSVKTLAALTALSKLTDAPTGLGEYDRPSQPVVTPRTPACKDTTLLAASPVGVRYDDVLWAKTMVAYSADCVDGSFTRETPGVTYEYAAFVGDQWVPAHSWETPGSVSKISDLSTDPGALTPLNCQDRNYDFTARPKVSAAFASLCAEAAQQEQVVIPIGGFRTPAEQADLYSEAEQAYGAEAGNFVSYSDGDICRSAFCQGWAVAVDPEAFQWLAKDSGCIDDAGEFSSGSECTGTRVSNAERFGFATPNQDQPAVLSYVAPAGLGPEFRTEADCTPYGMPEAAVIAAVFRCRLAQEAIPLPEREKVVKTALAVAECSSGLNPQSTVFGGQYVDVAKPGTDRKFPMGGLFGLSAAPPAWQSGDLGDPVASATYAAKLWMASRSFADFFCATGADAALTTDGVDPLFNSGAKVQPWVKTW